MGVINKARLNNYAVNYRALFFKELEANYGQLAGVALRFMMEVQSTGPQTNLNWVGGIPAMRQWIGDRVLNTLKLKGFYIENVDWETSIGIPANELDDDTLGIIDPRIRQLADAYLIHVYDNLVTLIEAGASTECYDGQYFFDTDHSEGDSGTQYNYTSSGALSSSTFRSARANMMELKGDNGKLLGIRPTHLWCGSTLEGTAEDILLAEKNSAGATNTDRKKCEILILPGLASTTMWGLVDLSGTLKPFAKLNRRPLAFTSLTDPDSPEFFKNRLLQFGIDYRGNYGYAMWQKMFMSTGT